MRNGTCIKCGGEVAKLAGGIYPHGLKAGQRPGVFVDDGAMIRRPSSYETFLCTACGYWEDYITDAEKLRRAAEGHGGWAPPA
ncbi:MAG TPA: hypothetical protein VD766_10045 [Solirubrobacterales bacterium]|nr:hypothetical protein [Solirubrobacterales bacterium]